jgi:zinc transport system permease protein
MLSDFLTYPFLTRVLVAGPLLALAAALLGVPLVQRRFSMIGDGLSHVGFGALTVSAALGLAPLAVSLPAVIVTAFIMLRLGGSEKRVSGDAAVAVFSATALSVGVIAAALSTGMTADIYGYMFGSVLALSRSDAVIASVASVAVIAVFALCYNRIFAVAFDEDFFRSLSSSTKKSRVGELFDRFGGFDAAMAVLTAIVVVLGMRIMGTLLISGLLVFPSLTAQRLSKSFRGVTLCAGTVSVACFLIGLALSYALNLPVGSAVVAVNAVLFVLAGIFTRLIKT